MNIGILVSSSNLSDLKIRTLKPILEDESFNIKVAVIDSRKGKSFKQKIIKNFKRGRGGYMIIMALKKIFSSKIVDNRTIGIKEYCHNHHVETIETTTPYSDEILNRIKSYDLDTLLLISGYGIIKEPLINITPNGILSYHHGDMRKYRGMPPVFWELYNNEKEVVVTVQRLDVGLDCGLPIEEKSIDIDRNDTLCSLKDKVQEESVDMMYKALYKLSNNYKPTIINQFGKIYTLPNFREWFIFNFKIFFRKFKVFK